MYKTWNVQLDVVCPPRRCSLFVVTVCEAIFMEEMVCIIIEKSRKSCSMMVLSVNFQMWNLTFYERLQWWGYYIILRYNNILSIDLLFTVLKIAIKVSSKLFQSTENEKENVTYGIELNVIIYNWLLIIADNERNFPVRY